MHYNQIKKGKELHVRLLLDNLNANLSLLGSC